jgi:hypothetical protein
MAKFSGGGKLSVPTGADGGEQIGYSLQDLVRYDIWVAYKKANSHRKKLITEQVKFNGMVKVKSALEALNDLYDFMDVSDVYTKNELYYHDEKLTQVSKFSGYFYDQLKQLEDARKNRKEFITVGPTGFSIFVYRRWLVLFRYFVEKSGIAKFERPKETTSDIAFSKMG